MAWIYILTFPNGKQYVGQTTNLKQRYSTHKGDYKLKTLLANAIRKYGWENIDKWAKECREINLDRAEVGLIKGCNTLYPNGYNLETGGHKNKHLSKETKDKIAKSQMGKILSEATKQKLRESSTGRIKSSETIKKLSERYITDEWRRNISIGNARYFKGKNFSDNHRRNLSKALEKPILQFSKDGRLIKEWQSALIAENIGGYNQGNISQVCHNKRITSSGFIWKFKDVS